MNGLQQLALFVLLTLAIVGLLAMRRRTLAKMSLRNISRKSRHSVVVVAGLLIATAMISGSLVVGDTLDSVIKQAVFKSMGNVDEVVYVFDENSRSIYFNQTVAYDLIASIEAGDMEYVDDAAPSIREGAAIIDGTQGTSAPSALIYGFDPDQTVNELLDPEGSPVRTQDVSGGSAVVNQGLADKLDAAPGDVLQIFPANGLPVTVTISFVALDEGMANWASTNLIFLDLTYAQTAVLNLTGKINAIDVSNTGGVKEGYLVTDEAILELENRLNPVYDYEIYGDKQTGVETAENTSDMITQIFIIMSSFTIIAGVALIINIFVMLAEERKPEMGIARAIGMQRGDLTQSFLFEGIVYALVASVIGTFAGLGIAAIMVALFADIYSGQGIQFALSFEWGSLGAAACAGFLITVLTVTVASWRVSKLNIVRAIRDIPEPMLTRSERRYILTGVVAVALGLLMTASSLSSGQAAPMSIGPSLLVLGIAMVAIRFVRPRWPFTIAGLFMVIWQIDPTDFKGNYLGETGGGMEMFIISGLLLIGGSVIVVMFNSDAILGGLMSVFGRRKSLLPIFRAAMSYPMNKKFRTGLTLFIFSLIMFTVVVIAMLASFQRESVDVMAQQFSGGYEIIGFSMRDVNDTELSVGWSTLNSTLGLGSVASIEPGLTTYADITDLATNESTGTNVIGFSEGILGAGGFSLAQRDEAYDTDADAWNAVSDDPALVIMDGSVIQQVYGPSFGNYFVSLGDSLEIQYDPGHVVTAKVIGIMDQVFLRGVYTSADILAGTISDYHQNLFYVDIQDSADLPADEIADEIENTFIEYGMNTYVIRDTVEEYMTVASSTMRLMEIFLAMGLIVGISGLGIITIRNVAERRQEIGVMRAIGFQRRMILNVFLLEVSFVSSLGIILGVVMGMILSWKLYDYGGFRETSEFVVPWWEVIGLAIVAFAITLLSTLPPSRSASRLAPAEALRRVD